MASKKYIDGVKQNIILAKAIVSKDDDVSTCFKSKPAKQIIYTEAKNGTWNEHMELLNTLHVVHELYE